MRGEVFNLLKAVDAAKREFKFLVVYLHAPYHQDTPEFLRDILCTQVGGMRQSSCTCWGG